MNSFYPPDADDAAGFTFSITVMAVGGGLLVYGKPPLAPAHQAVGKRTRPRRAENAAERRCRAPCSVPGGAAR